MSGCQMKSVLGRGRVTITGSIAPTARASERQHRHHGDREREAEHQQPQAPPDQPPPASTIPTDAAAIALNSGPTTIAPTTRIAESVITAIAASMTASTRNTR